jgi:tetratricopeptide (TPR) repeat protein
MPPNILSDDLRREIAERRVFAVIGAGVSQAVTGNATAASWAGLLRDGIARAEATGHPRLTSEAADRQRAALDHGDLDEWLGVAELVQKRLQEAGETGQWLRETVGALKDADRNVIEALFDLGIPLATTNYDSLLSDVTGLPAVLLRDGDRALRVLSGKEKAILHLHGHWQTPESIVLGIRSYERHLADARGQFLQQAMAAFNSVLFVGCGLGLDDPNFGKLRDWMRTVLRGEHRHYRLCLESEVTHLDGERQRYDRLFPLAYGTQHADLAPFLRSLKPVAPAPPPPIATTGLPAKPRCIGRDAEVEALVAAFLAEPPLPVPVLGPPGIGKSTAALAALHDPGVAAKFGARRGFVRLDGAKTANDVANEIATTLGVMPSGNPMAACFVALAQGRCALVLDNFETPWEADQLAVEDLLARLASGTGAALAVTVRGAARPAGPGWADRLNLPRSRRVDSKKIFLAIAGTHHENDPALPFLLEALDDLPLAVTLMAHLAEAEPGLAGLRQRWTDERAAMLRRGSGGSRLLDLPVSFELSINCPRMIDEARRLLSILALLPDGATHEHLGALLPRAGLRGAGTLRQTGLAFDDRGRLCVLAPLREYVQAAHPADIADFGRTVAFYGEFARLGEKLGHDGGAEASVRLAVEARNVEAILMRAFAADATSPPPFEAIRGYAKFQCFTGTGVTAWLEQAARRAAASGFASWSADCLQSLGDILLARSAYEVAREHYETALPLYREVGNVLDEANCIMSLGDIALERWEHEVAREYYEKALPLYRQTGSILSEANCITRLGDLALVRSAYEEASEHYQSVLPLYRKIGHVLGEANCICSLSDIALEQSKLEEARERCEKALPFYRQVGSVLGEANCLRRLGNIALAKFAPDVARRQWRNALGLYERIGEPFSIGASHQRLAQHAETAADRAHHLAAAYIAWRSIGRADLLKDLDDEFGPEFPALTPNS